MNNAKNNKIKTRPISPHLTIYKPQISSVLSIGHRFSGAGLFAMMLALNWWFSMWVFSGFKPCYINMMDNIIVKILLILTSYGFFYHLCTGIRHLVWDTGGGFSICAVKYSGILVIVSSIIFTLIFWVIV